MTKKREGPYKVEEYRENGFAGWIIRLTDGTLPYGDEDMANFMADRMNAAYAAGVEAGRKSRDVLRDALTKISSQLYVDVESATRCRQIAKQALAEDEKEASGDTKRAG